MVSVAVLGWGRGHHLTLLQRLIKSSVRLQYRFLCIAVRHRCWLRCIICNISRNKPRALDTSFDAYLEGREDQRVARHTYGSCGYLRITASYIPAFNQGLIAHFRFSLKSRLVSRLTPDLALSGVRRAVVSYISSLQRNGMGFRLSPILLPPSPGI